MLNYPVIQFDSNLSRQACLDKQQQVLNENELWSYNGLKRNILVITDYLQVNFLKIHL